MEPMGSFFTAAQWSRPKPKRYLGFAGGSGITPVLSILKTVLAEEPLVLNLRWSMRTVA